MGLTVDTIGVDIVARIDKLEAGLRAAESRVGKAAANMDDALGDVGSGRRGKKGKMFGSLQGGSKLIRGALAGFGIMQAGVGLAGLANVATDYASATRAKGFDESAKAFERLGKSIESLPFGLGALTVALEGLLDKWGRNFAERAAAADVAIASGASMTTLNEQAIEKKRRLEQQIEIANAKDEKEKAEITRRQAIDDADAEARRNAADKMNPKLIPEIRQREIDLADAEYNQRIRNLPKRQVPAFTTFSTALGSYKAANMPSHLSQSEKAAKDTAKHTKATADTLKQLLNKGGMIVAFA